MGMEFYGIFIPGPVPENWIGIFHLDSRSRKMGMEFAISRSRSRSPKVIPTHGCHCLGLRELHQVSLQIVIDRDRDPKIGPQVYFR